jgi:hypothetical protein
MRSKYPQADTRRAWFLRQEDKFMPVSLSSGVLAPANVKSWTIGRESLNIETSVYLGLDPVRTGKWNGLTRAHSVQKAFPSLKFLGEST